MKRMGKEPCVGMVVAGEEELDKSNRELQSKPSD